MCSGFAVATLIVGILQEEFLVVIILASFTGLTLVIVLILWLISCILGYRFLCWFLGPGIQNDPQCFAMPDLNLGCVKLNGVSQFSHVPFYNFLFGGTCDDNVCLRHYLEKMQSSSSCGLAYHINGGGWCPKPKSSQRQCVIYGSRLKYKFFLGGDK
jgi:hypothetical protein